AQGQPRITAFVGAGIIGEERGLYERIAGDTEAGVLCQQLILGPAGLHRKDPMKSHAIVVKPDYENELAAPAFALLQRDHGFVKSIVHATVLPDWERIF